MTPYTLWSAMARAGSRAEPAPPIWRLSDVFRGEPLQRVLQTRSLRQTADALVKAARLPSGELTDDMALVLVEQPPR
ncbi:MAG: hypothetical protein AAFV53_01260 [Myxococcota bacterium]